MVQPTYAATCQIPNSQLPSHSCQRTKIKAQPVAQGGIEANIGAKKIETMKQSPVTIAVRPVRPPSKIPAPLSMNAVTGDDPRRAPTEIAAASIQYATVERGKSPLLVSTTPQNRAMEYIVAVASIMSTYRNVKRASAKCEASSPMSQSSWFSVR
jgi:hypothetical protein